MSWVTVMVELPEPDADTLLRLLRDKLGFTEIDWCELQRADLARVLWGPSEPRTESGYGPHADALLRESAGE